MQEKDTISIDYFEDAERFADLINGFVYHGEKVIQPEDIIEKSRSVSRIGRRSRKKKKAGVKSQEKISAQTVTVDVVRKLTPVITIVIYWGKEPWDAPRSLKEMLDMSDYPDAMQDLIVDYPIHLLEVRKYADLSQFHTDIRYVFGFLQNDDNRDGLKQYLYQNKEVFSELSQSAYDMISVMSHSGELLEWEGADDEKGGGQDMCKAIKDMIEEGRQEGIKEGSQRINILIQHLIRDGRSDEIEHVVTDSEYQAQLLKEYGQLPE